MREIWDELAQYSRIHKFTCGVADEITRESEEERVHKFLMGLDISLYGVLRPQLLNQDSLPTLKSAYSSVVREERHKKIACSGEEAFLTTNLP